MDHQTIVAITAIAGASTWPDAVVLVWRVLLSPIGQALLWVLLAEAWMLSLTVHGVDRAGGEPYCSPQPSRHGRGQIRRSPWARRTIRQRAGAVAGRQSIAQSAEPEVPDGVRRIDVAYDNARRHQPSSSSTTAPCRAPRQINGPRFGRTGGSCCGPGSVCRRSS